MRTLLATASLVLVASCASNGGAPSAAAAPVSVSAATQRLVDMDGATVDVAGSLAAGHSVAFVFWQSWCESCIEEGPALAAAARAQAGRIDFVGVVPGPDASVDEAAVRARVAELGLPYPQIRDRDLALTKAFGVTGTPTIAIVKGANGDVVWSGHRPPQDWSSAGR